MLAREIGAVIAVEDGRNAIGMPAGGFFAANRLTESQCSRQYRCFLKADEYEQSVPGRLLLPVQGAGFQSERMLPLVALPKARSVLRVLSP